MLASPDAQAPVVTSPAVTSTRRVDEGRLYQPKPKTKKPGKDTTAT